jgi:hypothetical protein
MSLESQAKEAISIINSDIVPRKGGPMPYKAEFLLILLWGMYRKWGSSAIARQTRTHVKTVIRYQRRLHARPSDIFRLPILFHKKRLNRRTSLWHCEVCDRDVEGSETKARKHTAYHFFSYELVELRGVAEPVSRASP